MGLGGSGEDVALLLEQRTREVEALRAELVVERNKADGVEEKILRRVSNKTNQMVGIPSFSFPPSPYTASQPSPRWKPRWNLIDV